MKIRVTGVWIVALAAVAAGVGCSNSSGTPIAPIKGGAVPTATPTIAGSSVPATATPTSPGSSVPATATPTPHPSTVPTTPTPTPAPTTSGVAGNINCTAPVVTDGIYTSIDTEGIVTGSTYTEQEGDWEAIEYSPATPTPTPFVSPTPLPSATPPPATPTPTPAPTPTPVMVTLYAGEYNVTSYHGEGTDDALYTAAPTTGCFELILEQPVGGSAGQQRVRPFAVSATPTPNAFGDGEPNEPGTEAETFIDSGDMTSFTITNLTTTTGTGAFSFTNTSGITATGNVTITGSESFSEGADIRRRIDALHRQRMMVVRVHR